MDKQSPDGAEESGVFRASPDSPSVERLLAQLTEGVQGTHSLLL
jgi:hypothetical protein